MEKKESLAELFPPMSLEEVEAEKEEWLERRRQRRGIKRPTRRMSRIIEIGIRMKISEEALEYIKKVDPKLAELIEQTGLPRHVFT